MVESQRDNRVVDGVNAGDMSGHDGRRWAGQDRPGEAEDCDSGNDDDSPDAHDPSMAIPGQRALARLASLGASTPCGGYSHLQLFHAFF